MPEDQARADADTLANQLGVAGDTEQGDRVTRAWSDGVALIDRTLAKAGVDVETFDAGDESLLDRCYLETAAELYKRQDQGTDSPQFAVLEGGQPLVRGPRDPRSQSWPLLRALGVLPL